jgi:ribosomal protein S6--L-glutamate ligase
MRIAFLLQKPAPDAPSVSAVTAEIVARLRARGARVDLMVPEDGPLDVADIRPTYDLYVLKSKTPLTLSLAGALTVMGARVVNTFRSCNLARDKIATTAILAASGVPVPPSWAMGRAALLRPLLGDGPLWIKPQRGSRGIGVHRLDDPAALDDSGTCVDPYGLPLPLFAQRDVPSGGQDLKVYIVGDKLWAIAKPFPPRTARDKMGTPVPLPSDIRAAALVCGRALGLELYGVDFLVGQSQFFAIDVNAFPGYKGAAKAPCHIADYLYECTLRPYAQVVSV